MEAINNLSKNNFSFLIPATTLSYFIAVTLEVSIKMLKTSGDSGYFVLFLVSKECSKFH